VSGYQQRVGTLLARLLLVAAVLLMPLGMSDAAARQPAPAAPHVMMSMSHCPDSAPDHHRKGGIAECTMMCAAALPATQLACAGQPVVRSEPSPAETAAQLHGLHPETATPPPRNS
jgi:hypothetical protein